MSIWGGHTELIINSLYEGFTMLKKLALSLTLVAFVTGQAQAFSFQDFFWSTNTRKAATVGGGLAALFGAYKLWQKYSATTEETTTNTRQANEDQAEKPVTDTPAAPSERQQFVNKHSLDGYCQAKHGTYTKFGKLVAQSNKLPS